MLACWIVGIIVFSVMMGVFHQEHVLVCDAKNGACDPGQDPIVDDCCVWWCCESADAAEDATKFTLGSRPVVNGSLAPWTVWGDETMFDVTGERCVAIPPGDALSDDYCDVADGYADQKDDAACMECAACGDDAADPCVTRSDGKARPFEHTWPLAFLVFLIGPFFGLIFILIRQGQAVSGRRAEIPGTRRRRAGASTPRLRRAGVDAAAAPTRAGVDAARSFGTPVAATPRPPRGHFVGDESRRRRGRHADIPWETSRGDAAAATWIYYGDELRRRRRPRR